MSSYAQAQPGFDRVFTIDDMKKPLDLEKKLTAWDTIPGRTDILFFHEVDKFARFAKATLHTPEHLRVERRFCCRVSILLINVGNRIMLNL